VFVEVKARLTDDFGGAAAAVTAWKQRRIAHMAMDYLSRRTLVDCPCRFDVVAIDVDADGPRVIVYPSAFDSPF
jgi:putative endonuclease